MPSTAILLKAAFVIMAIYFTAGVILAFIRWWYDTS
jgi:hypothetical protein